MCAQSLGDICTGSYIPLGHYRTDLCDMQRSRGRYPVRTLQARRYVEPGELSSSSPVMCALCALQTDIRNFVYRSPDIRPNCEVCSAPLSRRHSDFGREDPFDLQRRRRDHRCVQYDTKLKRACMVLQALCNWPRRFSPVFIYNKHYPMCGAPVTMTVQQREQMVARVFLDFHETADRREGAAFA
jgi:hypothetical protein